MSIIFKVVQGFWGEKSSLLRETATYAHADQVPENRDPASSSQSSVVVVFTSVDLIAETTGGALF